MSLPLTRPNGTGGQTRNEKALASFITVKKTIIQMKKIFLLLTLALFSIYSANAQTKLNLEDIFQQIQIENPQLKMSDADIRALDEAAKGARNWESPQLSTGFWMAPYNPSLWKKGSDGETGMGQYMISGQQMFPNKGRQNANQSYMNAASSVEKALKGATINDLYAEAKKNYYQWQVSIKKIAVLRENEKLLSFMIKNTEIRYKHGQAKLSAYYKAKAALGNIQNIRLMQENEIQQRRIQLNTLMNRDKQLDLQIDTAYFIKDYSNSVFDSTNLASSRSDIKAVDENIKLTFLQRELELTKLKPEFGVRYEHMFGFGGSGNEFTLMAMVKIPAPWSTRAEKANIESYTWRAESLKQRKQTIINEASGMAGIAKKEIELKKKQIKLFETNIIPALRKNYKTMLLGYEQNTEELFELFDAWETLNSTQLDYLDQVQQLLLLQAEIERLLEIK